MIVRRNRPSAGQRSPRMIVRRSQGGDGEPPRPPRRHRSFGLRRRWVVGAAGVLAGVGLLAAATWAWQSPVFEVAHVEVEGNERVATNTVVDRANLFGQRMLTADLGAAQSRLYGLPLINEVRIEREWPNTIRIIVEERQAWGTWEQAGVTYTIDREGFVLGTLPPAEGAPAIRSSATGALRQGDRVDYQAVDAAAEIYDRLPLQLGTTVAEVAYLENAGVQVTTADGQVGLFGDSSSIAYKLSVWAALATDARQRGIDYTSIDLRYGNRPVIQ